MFLENFIVYIDVSLVDFDLGFFIRVYGVIVFKYVYFGEMDELGIDWFGVFFIFDLINLIFKLIDRVCDKIIFEDVVKKIEDV